MRDGKFGPWEAFWGFAVLAVILGGEIALILGTGRINVVPLPDAARVVQLIFFGH
ncbi:MAG TPA: hypothetical protein VL993_19110 [Stellaceae bacterium]|nr:hypothetical protein [Stellaceae bacterium]